MTTDNITQVAEPLQLYSYFRSSASFRVRIALELKGLSYQYRPVHLVRDEHLSDSYAKVSPRALVPQLLDGDTSVGQSLAIIEYLDELHPSPRLLPGTAKDRARVRSLSLDIACEIHPLNNLRVLRYLSDGLEVHDERRAAWYSHWVESGLAMIEQRLATESQTGRFCHGDSPTMADCVLVPQIFNAQRFKCRLDHLPTVMRIFEACLSEAAFVRAHPSACPDAIS